MFTPDPRYSFIPIDNCLIRTRGCIRNSSVFNKVVMSKPLLLLGVVVLILRFKTGASLVSFFDDGDTPRCERLDSSLFKICHDHGYNRTQMPNYLGHDDQTEASRLFKHFVRLIEKKCSPHLSFFMCAVHAPVCFSQEDFELALMPCRNVCESARAGCDLLMRRHANIRWDDSYDGKLRCDNFPDISDGLCMPSSPQDMKQWASPPSQSPLPPSDPTDSSDDQQGATTALTTTAPLATTVAPTTDQKPSATPKVRRKCDKCPKRLKPNYRNFMQGSYVFAIKGRMLKFKRRDGKKVILFQLEKIFNQSSVPMATNVDGIAELWTTASNKCSCPKMDRNQRYLVCGYEDRTMGRLLLPFESLVAKWDDRLEEEVSRWLRRAEHGYTPATKNNVPQSPPKQTGRPYRIRKPGRRTKR